MTTMMKNTYIVMRKQCAYTKHVVIPSHPGAVHWRKHTYQKTRTLPVKKILTIGTIMSTHNSSCWPLQCWASTHMNFCVRHSINLHLSIGETFTSQGRDVEIVRILTSGAGSKIREAQLWILTGMDTRERDSMDIEVVRGRWYTCDLLRTPQAQHAPALYSWAAQRGHGGQSTSADPAGGGPSQK